jgi:Fe(3+) dicitrate transport protein
MTRATSGNRSRARLARPAVAACVHLALTMCTQQAIADEPPKPEVWKSAAGVAPKSEDGKPKEDGAKDPPAPSLEPGGGAPGAPPADPAEKSDAKAEGKLVDVRVIGSSADALQKIPGSGQLIGAKDVARAQPNDVAELLRRVPGLVVRQEQGGGLRLDISVRGLDNTRSRRVLVLEDGVPVANNPYGEPDLFYSTPFERVRGIEVVKGSGSILFGPQTVGGVVQFLTHAPPESRRVYMWMNAGAPGQFELLGRYGDAWGDVRYIAQVFGKRGDGARGESYWATDAFAKIAVPISARSELTAKVGYHEEAATSTDVGLTQGMFEADPRRATLAPYDQVHLRRIDGSVTHRLWLGEGVELTTLAYATSTSRLWRRQDYDRGPCGPEVAAGTCPPFPGVAYDRIVGDITTPGGAIYFRNTNSIRDRSYGVFGIEPRLSARFTTGAIGHTLQVGGRFLSESASRLQRAGDNPLSEAGESISDEQNGTIGLAGYVQDRMAFTEYLLITPGFRFEYASSKRSIRRAVVEGAPRDVTLEGASQVVAPLPGIGIVAGTPRLHGFGGLHVGFAPPRLTTAINNASIDEQLDAERAVHYEAGVRALPWRFLRAEATLFLSNFENQVVPATRAGEATTDLVNGGRTRHLGLEAAVRLDVGRALLLPLSIDLYAAYTGLSTTFVHGANAGESLPYAPQHTASAVLDVEHAVGLGGQVSWTYVGAQLSGDAVTGVDDVTSDPTGRTGEVPAYHILDFSLRYTHEPTGLGATLAVKNALDEIYIASRRPDGIFPGGFRQILGSVRWTYDESAQ